MNVLAVVPARGGSKGIPRKNLRILAGKPLIWYIISAAKKAKRVDRVVVTTEDEEIALVARRFGAEVVHRPPELAGDAVPLDPVVDHAVREVEASGFKADIVLTLQPTSPLLKPESIDRAVEILARGEAETVISVIDRTHLYWTVDEEGRYKPLYKERLNRQYLPPLYQETGGIIGSMRRVVTAKSRIGTKLTLIELSRDEAVDIDSDLDWWVVEKLLQRRRIAFRVDGYREIGLGHVYRALTLAHRILDHEIFFVMDSRFPLGIRLVRDRNYRVVEFSGDPVRALEELKPDLVINDVLDTEAEYVRALKERGFFVVNFEDLGPGALEADVVINALYSDPLPKPHHYYGPDYVCLREEFYSAQPRTLRRNVTRVLVTFGGTDPGNLTAKALRALDKVRGDFDVTCVLGLGFSHAEELEKLLATLKRKVTVRRNIRSMSEEIRRADLAITSAGRTVYEMAALGTPTVVMAQNEREMRHLFANAEHGVANLGLGVQVSVEELIGKLQELVDDYEVRREMRERMLAVNLRSSVENVLRVIFETFEKWQTENARKEREVEEAKGD